MTGDLVVPNDNYPIKGDLNKVISYETQREIFLSKREGGQMLQSIDMNNNHIENLRIPTASDHACSKGYADDNFLKKSGGVMVGPLSMKRNDLIGLPDTPKFGYSAVNRTYVTNQLDLKLDKATEIDMKNKKITALATDAVDMRSATNVSYVQNTVNASATNIITTLSDSFNQKIIEAHISSSTNKKDVFRYLMEDADQSSSEHDIIVVGIVDFSGSPYEVNKKAYSLKLGKGAQNEYSSRIGFNMYKLPEGEYTLAFEFFPPSLTNVRVDVVSTSLNMKQQATKLFPNYSRTIVHLHKWRITPPERIFVDLKCQGTASSDAQGSGFLIVYGIKGAQNDVDSAVYDSVYTVENGNMEMQTDLDMNGHKLFNSIHYIHGILNTNKGKTFLLKGCDKIIISSYSHILTIKAMYFNLRSSYPAISLKIKHSFLLMQSLTYTSLQSTQLQTITINLKLAFGHMGVELVNDVKNEEILLLIEYKAP